MALWANSPDDSHRHRALGALDGRNRTPRWATVPVSVDVELVCQNATGARDMLQFEGHARRAALLQSPAQVVLNSAKCPRSWDSDGHLEATSGVLALQRDELRDHLGQLLMMCDCVLHERYTKQPACHRPTPVTIPGL